METLKNILVDTAQTARYGTPIGFWESIIEVLPGIAKEIATGKTPEEMLQRANKDINPVVEAWSKMPVGLINEELMQEAADETPVFQAVTTFMRNLGFSRA
ncbi:Uncharacterized protein TPAR_02281 [Tolypocladium paradoxum]|uniref:Uncharacterized protein n=1 Tax=Tolypocladium paradoxum TaxID=94208 RepID=A0A2S4L4Z8_9HYPO|nr:Uncharacterized protein TPAR_02281 [Tolypocladium paradoxum]